MIRSSWFSFYGNMKFFYVFIWHDVLLKLTEFTAAIMLMECLTSSPLLPLFNGISSYVENPSLII